MSNWKIDINPHSDYFEYGLFRRGRGVLKDTWECINIFQTRAEARAEYLKLKDLPEYRD